MDGLGSAIGNGISGLVGGAVAAIGNAIAGVVGALGAALPAGALPLIGIVLVIVVGWVLVKR
jgi:hypothetical protein